MRAVLLARLKETLPDGCVIEIRIWRLPSATAERPHGLKYSLFYGKPGERIIGYDNEAGKDDHCHHRGHERPFRFTTIDPLIDDFRAEVEQERRSV